MNRTLKTVDKTAERIDYLLGFAFSDWRSLEEIETWEPSDQIGELAEWPLAETHLAQLKDYADQMNFEQKTRYAELIELVEKNRPILERIREALTT